MNGPTTAIAQGLHSFLMPEQLASGAGKFLDEFAHNWNNSKYCAE
jgi:activator of 2-hydroxyglutaryl-CoA dehydratase